MYLWDIIEHFLENIVVYRIITDLVTMLVGAGLCFGALKWRRGLLTTTAVAWGFIIGAAIAIMMMDSLDGGGMIFCVLAGTLIVPILTYTVAGVNRFILGFLVISKISFMLTTVLAKEGAMNVETAVVLPLVAGTIGGIVLMAWIQMRVSAFVLSCSFVGACEGAAAISDIINMILYGATGNFYYLADPIDIIFALFGIELTDIWTLVGLIVLMFFGIRRQIGNLKSEGIPLDASIIGFEAPYVKNGTLYVGGRVIDTTK